MLNLVDNALVHAGATSERRVVELSCALREGRVALSVRDYGRGIPEALLEDVFEPFVSGAQGAGVGLGLALVRALVARMGGLVFAENAAGGGLRVTALLRPA